MSERVEQYTNAAWIAALRRGGDEDAPLLEQLAGYVRRVLASTLSRRALAEGDLEELAQEAMLQLLKSLDTFRGDSAFTTWVAAVATRVAYTELRRRTARESKHAAFREAQGDALEACAVDVAPTGELTRTELVEALHAAIETELTDRQRIATLALLRGVPTVEIAEQLGSNPNAVYKLVHDARLRLRAALERRGVTAELLQELTAGGSR